MDEQLGSNKYLLWVTSSSCGKESFPFGSCRPCNQQEIYYHAPKFRKILGEIDTSKLKFIDFCYYNSTECTVDYYLESSKLKQSEPMTLDEAIAHAKEVAASSKRDECGKEHAQLAEWLQELKVQRDRVDVLAEQGTIYEADIKIYQESLIYYMEEKKKAELKLASYEDKTYISAEFLMRNGFEKRQFDYLYCDDCEEISAQEIDSEAGEWRIEVAYLDGGYPQTLDIYTVGQLRMFLAIEGLNEIANQLK